MKEERIKVLRKEPGKEFEVIEIDNTLKALQKEIGGHIEVVRITMLAAVICDEEGRLKGKAHCCNLCGRSFVGTILVVGVDDDEFISLPPYLSVVMLARGD